MTFYRPTTIPERHLEAVAAAYRAAGLTPPNRTTDAMHAVDAEPTTEAVAAQLAAESYDATDADTWLEDALVRIARAQAADALRKSLAVVAPRVQASKRGAVVAQAVRDLSPAFTKAAKQLARAAEALDRRGPLLIDNAVRDDTTKQLKSAESALALLGTFAGLHPNRPVRDVPGALVRVLPLVTLPDCCVELVRPSLASEPNTENEADLAGTRSVRALTRALEGDTDAALVGIARGEYPGVAFALADRAELRVRSGIARRAFQRQSVKQGGYVRVGAA